MKDYIIEKLTKISPTEQAILRGEKLNLRDYTFSDQSVIKSENMLKNKLVEITVHTRFCDFPLHGHDYMEIMYVYSGSITHIIDGKKIEVKQGNLLILNKFVTHSIKKANEKDIGINFILSDAFLSTALSEDSTKGLLWDFISENIKSDGRPQYLLFDIAEVYTIRNLLDNLIYTIVEQSIDSPLLPKVMSLLFAYLSVHSDSVIASNMGETDNFKILVSEYLDSNYTIATLSEIASMLQLSQEYVSRKITKTFGKSFKQLLMERRLLVAEKLLVSTKMNVADIARAVGYENSSHFYKLFLNKHNKTPNEWRN